jgi:hypothetical protein
MSKHFEKIDLSDWIPVVLFALFLLALILGGCAAQKPKAAVPPTPTVIWDSQTSFTITCGMGWSLVINADNVTGGTGGCVQDATPVTPPPPKLTWVCHSAGRDDYSELYPAGVPLWKIRLLWMFGARCEKQP